MKQVKIVVRPAVLLMCLLATAGNAFGQQAARDDHPTTTIRPTFVEQPGVLEFSGQLIVRPLRGLNAGLDAAARDRLAGMIRTHHTDVDDYVLDIPQANGQVTGSGENTLAAELMATGLYEYAEPNWICYPVGEIPNDPWFTQQWHHTMMGSPAGWAISTGSASQIIAFTDTGIDLTHPDLAPHRVPGYDSFLNWAEVDGASVADANGHGTHVAGCAAAIGDNAIGVAGLNWNARIMMVRVTIAGGNGAYVDDVLEGARWAVDHGAKTISASFSGVASSAVQTTGQYIKQHGGLYFYAAGNEGRNLSGFDWPDVIVVGASSRTDERVGLSSYGRGLDLFAPGEAIVSTIMGGGYQAWTGTSMSAPVASGVASIIWAINPALNPDEVQTILFSTCRDMGPVGEDEVYGFGRVDMQRAAIAAQATVVPPCPADFNGDGFLDFFDLDAFVECYEGAACGGKSADFNADGFVDFFDYDAFVLAYETGC